jgi:ATP-dependent Lhr-like helicase
MLALANDIDHFDVIRKGEHGYSTPAHPVRSDPAGARPRPTMRRPVTRPEGRWSLIPWKPGNAESEAVAAAERLLNRYGIAARELAAMDATLPSWRVLYEVLGRMELAGDVRRGYFIEGLSGAQFALPEAMRLLHEVSQPVSSSQPVILVHSLDPANLYGSGAPLDIPLLDGGTRSLSRRMGHWLVVRGGRPVLIIEKQGKTLTALASASAEEITQAVSLLPATLELDSGLVNRQKVTVEEWNGQPVTATAGRAMLEAAGFVRDYQGMTLYAAWR